MRDLRTQLLLSHFALIVLLLALTAGGVVSAWHLGRSIDRILKDNIKSVIAAQAMKEALERQDNAVLLYLAGKARSAREQYEQNRTSFDANYRIQDHNITERGERQMTDAIGRLNSMYRSQIEKLLYARPAIGPDAARARYVDLLQPVSEDLRRRVQGILDINLAAIQRANQRAKAEARTASWAGSAVVAVSFCIAILFALRVVSTALAPIRSLARQAEEIGAGHLNQRIELHRSDEIGALAGAFNRMAANLRDARQLAEERLHRAERMSDAAIDSLYDPVIVTDANGCVVHLNRAAEGLFGPADRATGRPVAGVVSDPRIAEAVGRAIDQERVSAEEDEAGMVPLQVDSAERTFRLRATPMRDDAARRIGAVAVLEDVTHLRELDRLKTEFIGVASHELRTPVTSLMLAVQLLDEGAAGELSPRQRQLVASARDDLGRLERIMRDLLELTRLEAGVTALHLEPVSPREIVVEAADAIRAEAEAKGLVLTVDAAEDLPHLMADRTQIGRALTNLLSNAVRHTPSGGCIEIGARTAGPQVSITVRDTGVGIAPEYQPRVFERFVQVPGATRGGAGLGLSIAQTIARAHGGDISVLSTVGSGSTFTITLPALQGAPGTAGEGPPDGQRGQST